DGYFLPPPKPRVHELIYTEAAKKLKIPVIPARMSMLTQKINNDRGVCFYCRQCNRACSVLADFSSSSVLVKPLLTKGEVDVYLGAMVRTVTTDSEGKATGISYVNKADRQEYKINARSVVLAASACSSARIMMNSVSDQHPNGISNSSDHVGRYLHDSTGASRSGILPQLLDRKRFNEDGVGGMHVYSPWWLDNKSIDFPRGYHIEVWGGMGMPSYGFGMGMHKMAKYLGHEAGGYGDILRKDVKRLYGASIGFGGRGECIAREDNYCELDPEVVDEFGIPVLRFNYTFSDHELNQAKHMQKTFAELFHAMGAEPMWSAPGKEDNYGLNKPGEIIHEVGTTRMGDDPSTSVTNKYQQLHDCDNVFITDAGPFVSQADKNCTWTIMALAWRASDYIVDQLKKMNI
ncbi:MAG: GMC family oxidoreductase N-terminal domain-containing protein, partial [Bacteroidia bacterium]|nr:GMC family oxidoreductase N-terminal domain-containing protein [Bacteroidia bacterium]